MNSADTKTQIVYTNKAKCLDCYRCIRVCPVKAISMKDGQAQVVPEKCLACGTCIRECPQGAKNYRRDLDHAKHLVSSFSNCAVSLAPSFAAVFNEWERKRLPSALRKLGFSYIGETAFGAYLASTKNSETIAAEPEKSFIIADCPAIVNYIERYKPEFSGRLIATVSPMIAHAKHIKSKLGEGARVIFIGPCIAKKDEAERNEYNGIVDCVLTFEELKDWFQDESINLTECEESSFNDEGPGTSRFYPLAGGAVKTANLDDSRFSEQFIYPSGYNELLEALDSIGKVPGRIIIEPLFCNQGCINGPANSCKENLFTRRNNLISYASAKRAREKKTIKHEIDLGVFRRRYDIKVPAKTYSEDDITAIMNLTGNKNCGACGYDSCREKALAILNGMAEQEMCIPYMRRLAEIKTDRIMETTPNGVVILDEHLNILSVNPAFKRFFMCTDAICGKHISYLMDPEPFIKLSCEKDEIIDTVENHEKYNIICHEKLYSLPEENKFVGIFINITHSQKNKEQLDKMRTQLVFQAQELLQHQITTAQEIAKYLGESTARGEALVDKLLLIAGNDNQEIKNSNNGLWDTYIRK